MASRFHNYRTRRAERETAGGHGTINLVPLVDVLTSIVFFSLLTYTGATMAALTAYDLTLPPTVVTNVSNTPGEDVNKLHLLLAVRIENNGLQVEHSGDNGGFRQRISGMSDQSLQQMQQVMEQIKQQYPQNDDVLVVPSDEVSYDDVIRVLEHIRLAKFGNISLGSRARVTQVAVAGR